MMERKIKRKLSKGILEMKFMKKSREAAQAEMEAEEGRVMFASEQTEAMRAVGVRCIVEPSFVPCEELVITRQSYHGMNPEVEKLLRKDCPVAVKEEDVDVPAEEVALATNMANKFKRGIHGSFKPPSKKTKFMKPSED